jgi:putative addiction module component (TIGR02574 family)
MMTDEEIVAAALGLDHKRRAELVHRLLQSLEDLTEAEATRLWDEEVDRRIRAQREGKIEGTPGEKVFARGRALLSP